MAEAFAVSHPFLGKLSLSSLAPSQLVYMPYPSDPDEKFGHMEHHVTIRAKDGTELNGWYFDRGADKPLVVAYHGKGVHIGWAVEDAANDHSRSYLMINYRGYGDSQGVAREKDLISDACECIDWCRNHGRGYSSLVIAGCSLGTGIAVQVAAAVKADKLILIAPYDCIYNAAVHLTHHACPKIPLFMLKGFCKACVGNILRSVDYAPQVTCPVVIFMARTDDTIPHESTWNLFHAFTATHPETVWVNCTHNDFFQTPGFKELFFHSIENSPAQLGNEDAAWSLVNTGDDYYNGNHGFEQNFDKALHYYRSAADANFHWGYFNLGKCYREGHGAPQNLDAARKWFRKAAEQQNFWALLALAELGDAACMNEVGDCYYDGRAQAQGCPISPEKALHWYRQAAEHGYHWGFFNLGKCYAEGTGTPKDELEARKHFRKAADMEDNPWALRSLAELGDAEAALRVAHYYETGCKENCGLMQDDAQARHFRTLAQSYTH